MIDRGKIPEEEKTPLVIELLHIVQAQQEDIQHLRDEVARLKGQKGKPKIPPSRLEKDTKQEKRKKKKGGKRPGSKKRSKTKDLPIHETIPVPPKESPAGSARAGRDDWIVQGFEIRLHNVRYRLERWITPEGKLVKGELPKVGSWTFRCDAAKLYSPAVQSRPCHAAFDMGRAPGLRGEHLLRTGQSNPDRRQGGFPP